MTTRVPLFKRVDQWVFRQLDTFRATPAYNRLVEQYATLEEHEQTLTKGGVLAGFLLVPLIILGVLWWHNAGVRDEVVLRSQVVERMQNIISQNSAAAGLAGSVAAPQAFLDAGELTTRLNAALSGSGVDTSKLRVNNFTSDSVSPQLTRAEADFGFTGLNTTQLVNVFTNLITRERFRISSVDIKRNPSSNLLDGNFHGVHFGQVAAAVEGEE